MTTVSDESQSKIQFTNPIETLVVVLEYQRVSSSVSTLFPLGYMNTDFNNYLQNQAEADIPSSLYTYTTGPCQKGVYSTVYSHHGQQVLNFDIMQLYVKLTGTSSTPEAYSNSNDDDDRLSDRDIAG